MRKILPVFGAAFLLMNLAASDFPLIRDRKAACSIVLPGTADAPAVAGAARRFNETLKIITGAVIPITKEDVPGNRITFVLKKPDSLLTIDNFAITFPDAQTMQIEGTAASVQWAFNHIIREFAKAEWILPESCGLSYTPMTDLVVPAEKMEVKNISWPLSRSHSCGPLWPKMNYRRGVRIGHDLTLHAFPKKKYGRDNSWPEAIMPILNGKKIKALPMANEPANYWQPCYSNPETAKIAVENILEYLKENPDLLYLSLGTNDNNGFCECPECLKLDKNSRMNRSESYFTFINRVMEEVCKKHPNLLVTVFAYDKTYLPPNFKLHPNAVVYLTIDINSCVDPKLLERHKKIITEWGEKAFMLGVWDYSWGYPYIVPRLYAPYHLDMLKFLHEHNARAYGGESFVTDASEGPKQYLISKFVWNSNQNMKKLVDEWYVRCVGEKAAPHLKTYYKVWNDYFTGSAAQKTPWFKSAPSVYMAYYDISSAFGLTESDIQAADEAMKQVVTLAGTDQEKQRAELLLRHWQYTLLRLRMRGVGIYDVKGNIDSEAQALRLLDAAKAFPEYKRKYKELSEILLQDREIAGLYRNPYWMKEKGSPLTLMEMMNPNSHIVAASAFADSPAVKQKMKEIENDPQQTPVIRQLCRVLANPDMQKNLLPDGNAENGIPENVEIHPALRKYGELLISDKNKAEGESSFLISVKGPDTLLWLTVPAKPMTTYLATFKAFILQPSAEGYMETNLYAQRNGIAQQYRLPPPLKLSGGIWQTFSVLTSTNSSSDGLRLRIHLREFENGDEVFIDDIRLTEIGPIDTQEKK